MEVKIKKAKGAITPTYATNKAAGADLYSTVAVTLFPGERAIVPTGIFIELPANHEAQIRPRSGMAAKYGITVLNTPGTIDEDYRGEIKVILVNLSKDVYTIAIGDRVAQMVIAPYVQGTFVDSEALTDTVRHVGGLGSTGK